MTELTLEVVQMIIRGVIAIVLIISFFWFIKKLCE